MKIELHEIIRSRIATLALLDPELPLALASGQGLQKIFGL